MHTAAWRGWWGETSDTDCPLMVRCGLMARATARLERSAFGREGPHTIVVRYVRYAVTSHVCVYVKVCGEMFLSFGVQVQQLL